MNEQAIIEKTVDTVENTLEAIEQTKVVARNNPWIIAGAGVVGFVAGAAVSYWATKKYALALMEETLQEEVEKAQLYFDKLHKDGDFETPERAAAALISDEERAALEAADELRGQYDTREGKMDTDYSKPFKGKKSKQKTIKITEEEVVEEGRAVEQVHEAIARSSIWKDGKPIEDGGWDYDSIERSEDKPYIISEEEFYQSAADGMFESYQMTYYEFDGILADVSDDTVDLNRVGEENMKQFGRFPSADPNTLYIKNEMLKRVYEVVLSTGSFRHEVQGFEYTPEEGRKLSRRQRGDDD